MKVLFCIASFLLPLALLAQDQPVFAPASVASTIKVPQILNRGLGGMIGAYTDRPPDLTLIPHGEGARKGNVWVQTVGWGLLIVGEVDGERPEFPRNKNLILEKDHIEIWLADGKDPDLPPIGWGNQFDQVTLAKGADSCADWARRADTPAAPDASGAEKRCRTWAATQTEYRSFFKRLFVRQWLVTPDYAVESYATPAYDRITSRFASDHPDNEEIPAPLLPVSQLQMWPGPGKNRVGYTFEIMIPFTSFPPLSSTDLSDLRLMVDVFNPAAPGKKVGPYSTSSPSRAYGKPETFNHLRLDPSQQFHLTPCDVPLAAKDKYGDPRAAWFIPKSNQAFDFEHDAFIIVNDGSGYQYEPEALCLWRAPCTFSGTASPKMNGSADRISVIATARSCKPSTRTWTKTGSMPATCLAATCSSKLGRASTAPSSAQGPAVPAPAPSCAFSVSAPIQNRRKCSTSAASSTMAPEPLRISPSPGTGL